MMILNVVSIGNHIIFHMFLKLVKVKIKNYTNSNVMKIKWKKKKLYLTMNVNFRDCTYNNNYLFQGKGGYMDINSIFLKLLQNFWNFYWMCRVFRY